MVDFSLAQLEYVVAVDTHRHFATAAAHCFVTQPTLSMQIRKMEDHLGIVLFDRSKQPVVPTTAGQRVVEQARRILAEARRIGEIVSEEQNQINGTLRIGIIPTLSAYLLPRFIGNFSRRYPAVEIHVQEKMTEDVIQALKKDQLDAGLIVTPLDEPGIEEKTLFFEEIFAYYNQQTAPGIPSRVQAQQLSEQKIWMLTQGNCFREQLLSLCALKAQSRQPDRFAFDSGSLETLRRLVDSEGGVTLLPELMVMEFGPAYKTQLKRIGPNSAYRRVSLVYRRQFAKARLLELMEEEVRLAVPLPGELPAKGEMVRWR